MIEGAERRGQLQGRRHRRRGDRRQHRPRAGAGRACQRLPCRPRRARQDVDREGAASEGARCGGAHDPLRRRQGSSRVLPGLRRAACDGASRRVLRRPVQQPRQPGRARTHDRPRAVGAMRQAASTRSSSAIGSAGTITGLTRYFRGVAPHGRVRARRSGRLDPRRLRDDRTSWRGGLVGGRRHRRGLHSRRSPTCPRSGMRTRSTTRKASRRRASCCVPRAFSAARRPARWSRPRCAIARRRRRPSASRRSSATPERATCRRSTTTSGCSTRACSRGRSSTTCATSSRAGTTKARWSASVRTTRCSPRSSACDIADVSQLPVLDGQRLAGVVDESDLLMKVHADPAMFREPVASAMTTKLQTLAAVGEPRAARGGPRSRAGRDRRRRARVLRIDHARRPAEPLAQADAMTQRNPGDGRELAAQLWDDSRVRPARAAAGGSRCIA